MKPRVVRMYSDWSEMKWDKNRKIDFWHECLYKTLKLFCGKNVAFWEPHIWSPINKYKFIEMCEKYNYKEDISCIILSLYYNFIEQTPTKGFDHLHIESNRARIKIAYMTASGLPRHLSWTDAAFNEKRFRDILDDVVGFGDSDYVEEKNSNDELSNSTSISISISSIQKLRDGIKNGTIVKEMKPDGTHIWRKVRK
jgi:hypothetical protein